MIKVLSTNPGGCGAPLSTFIRSTVAFRRATSRTHTWRIWRCRKRRSHDARPSTAQDREGHGLVAHEIYEVTEGS